MFLETHTQTHVGGCPCGIMVKAMDCRIVVSKVKLDDPKAPF